MKTWTRQILLIASLILVISCATSQKINNIRVGMSKAEVIDIMGTPTSTSAQGEVEYLNYALYDTTEAARWGNFTTYFVRIINGKVESFGRKGDFDSTKTPTQKIEIETKSTSETKPSK